MHKLLSRAIFFLPVMMGGCTVIESTSVRGEELHLFGYVRITGSGSDTSDTVTHIRGNPARADRSDISILGAWWNDGAGLGYKRSIHIAMPPGCDVLFLVPDQATLERILPLLESSSMKESICADTQ